MHHARRLLIILLFAVIAAVPLAGPSAAQGVPGGSLVCVRGMDVPITEQVAGDGHTHAAAGYAKFHPEADAEPSDIMIVLELISAGVY